jgi:ribosomal protein S18 acetylase RimI-like enzyme
LTELLIRKAEPADLSGVREICLKTADAGKDGTALFKYPELLWAVYADPYLAYCPQTCFVALDDGGICGYILAALDSEAMHAWALSEWLPPIQKAFPKCLAQSCGAADRELLKLIHEPDPLPPFVQEYPSHLHIDLLERVQKHGLGRGLIERLLEELTKLGSKGVHFGVSGENINAQAFYKRIGFEDLLILPDNARLMGMRLPKQT